MKYYIAIFKQRVVLIPQIVGVAPAGRAHLLALVRWSTIYVVITQRLYVIQHKKNAKIMLGVVRPLTIQDIVLQILGHIYLQQVKFPKFRFAPLELVSSGVFY
jgi:hypothetical protein